MFIVNVKNVTDDFSASCSLLIPRNILIIIRFRAVALYLYTFAGTYAVQLAHEYINATRTYVVHAVFPRIYVHGARAFCTRVTAQSFGYQTSTVHALKRTACVVMTVVLRCAGNRRQVHRFPSAPASVPYTRYQNHFTADIVVTIK